MLYKPPLPPTLCFKLRPTTDLAPKLHFLKVYDSANCSNTSVYATTTPRKRSGNAASTTSTPPAHSLPPAAWFNRNKFLHVLRKPAIDFFYIHTYLTSRPVFPKGIGKRYINLSRSLLTRLVGTYAIESRLVPNRIIYNKF